MGSLPVLLEPIRERHLHKELVAIIVKLMNCLNVVVVSPGDQQVAAAAQWTAHTLSSCCGSALTDFISGRFLRREELQMVLCVYSCLSIHQSRLQKPGHLKRL